jgi:membrane-bound lytic murein transglycosylase B
MARLRRAKRAAALVPIALISVAWTAALATAGSGSASTDDETLPDGSTVPSQTVKPPASMTSPRTVAPGMRSASDGAVPTASTSGIPAVALAAYQRGATVIDAADRTCNLPWQLLAAIGRVESDHGRSNGNHLTDKGFATPGIFGPALNGKNGTTLIKDTDAGQYDDDARYDRAVGPMQFIPSTWAIVGVDADNDGRRDPQDIYDAALGSAVYLCSGPGDLATEAGQRAAVLRYNHSQRYADLVLAIERAYESGNFTSVPNSTSLTGFSFGTPPVASAVRQHQRHHAGNTGGHRHGTHHSPGSTTNPGGTSTGAPTANPTANPTGAPPTNPSVPAPPNPTKLPTKLPTSLPTKLPSSLPTGVLTKAEAAAKCAAKGLIDNPLDPSDAFDKCVYNLTH